MERIWDLSGLPYLEELQHFKFRIEETCGDVVAVGGKLSPGLLLSAYQQGIFPWYNEGEEIYWWCPRQRFVLLPHELHVAKSLRKYMRQNLRLPADRQSSSLQKPFYLTVDRAFANIISACAQVLRPGQLLPSRTAATWITWEMQCAYIDLHRRGYAHSVECWQRPDPGTPGIPKLVGGLYGIALGRCFYGESMFSHVPNASKMAFTALALFLQDQDFALIDCQQKTNHLERFGARYMARPEFLRTLASCGVEMLFGEGLPTMEEMQEHCAAGKARGNWGWFWPEFPEGPSLQSMLGL